MMYNKEELLAEADTRTVAEFMGAPLIKRGASMFTECPGHIINKGKREKKLTHFQISKRGGYCYACGYRANPITFAMDYSTNILGIPFTEDDACGLVADTLGGRDLYYISDTGGEKKNVKGNSRMPLSFEDAEIIGLSKKNGVRIITSVSDVPFEDCEKNEYYDSEQNSTYEYYSTQFVPYSLQTLWQEDRTAWKYLIKNKAAEAFEKYDAFQKVFRKSKSADGMMLANCFLSKSTAALQVAARFGYKFKRNREETY